MPDKPKTLIEEHGNQAIDYVKKGYQRQAPSEPPATIMSNPPVGGSSVSGPLRPFDRKANIQI
jgi:hypothetical protein